MKNNHFANNSEYQSISGRKNDKGKLKNVVKLKKSISPMILSLLCFSLFSFFPTDTARADGYFTFDDATKKLTVSTQMLDLKFEGGAIVYVKDKATGEVLTDTNSTVNFPTSNAYGTNAPDPRNFDGFTSISSSGNHTYRRPNNSAVVFSQIGDHEAKLIYSPAYYGSSPATGSELVYNFSVDVASGEILITLTGTEPNSALSPFTIDLPIMNFQKNSVIMSSGRKWSRSDPDGTDKAYAGWPQMAVAEGDNSAIAAWSENTKALSGEYVQLRHTAGYDHIVLHDPQDPKQTAVNGQVIVGGPWRIGTHTNWLSAAKRWRALYEQRTGAKPLWQNSTPWVRNIHTTYKMWGNTSSDRLNTLAGMVPSQNLLFFTWNGDRIVLFGDHAFAKGLAVPNDATLANIKSHGWRLMEYHPWTLINSPSGAIARLQYLADKSWLQSGYIFTPDYADADEPSFTGKTGDERLQDWFNYWLDVDSNYYSGSSNMLIHPAATKFREYLVRNFGNYCTFHSCDGAYFDILGSDSIGQFPADRKIMNGEDYRIGEKNAIAYLRQQLPNLAIMSEYLTTELMPYTFYTWQGGDYPQNIVMNHPFFAALIGSYMWTMDPDPRGKTDLDDTRNALIGTLPQISLNGEYQVADSVAVWSQVKGKLFAEAELWNDLPDNWDPEALAYYRSKYGTWFKFKKIGDNDFGYYEEIPELGDVLRLQKSNPVIIPRPDTAYSSADLNSDSKIDLTDFNILKTDFLKIAASLLNPKSDINGDGQATVKDVGILMSGWK